MKPDVTLEHLGDLHREAARRLADIAFTEHAGVAKPTPFAFGPIRLMAASVISDAVTSFHGQSGIASPNLNQLMFGIAMDAFLDRWDDLAVRFAEGGRA